MKVLVTGGAGFVGSHVCDMLLEEGHEVASLDNLSMGVDFTPAGVITKRPTSLEGMTLVPEGTELVVHCAARADVSQNWASIGQRDRLLQSNVIGTANLLECSKGIPVIFLSTCAVYGDNADCKEGETAIASSPYAASKLAGEAYVQAYAYARGLPWHIFRLGCVVGSRYHHGHVADFVRSAQKNRSKTEGAWVTPLSDGLTRKSCVHVLDVCEAVKLASIEAISPGVYNCANGTWSPRDTIRVMAIEGHTEWPYAKTHGWIGDPMAVASGSKLRAAGWRPQRSIEQGVREALEGLGWK